MRVVNVAGERVESAPVKIASAPKVKKLGDAGASAFFFDGKPKPAFHFTASRQVETTVELVRETDGAVVRSWQITAGPGRDGVVAWDGRGSTGPQATGGYRFRLAGPNAGATAVAADSVGRFDYYDHIFPIRGKHNLGYTETNNFGGGRGHQGQDMFAACGTPMVAARGGKVKYAGYGAAAGNYVAIDGEGTGVDYAYMHMRLPALVRAGARVRTGQQIGEVGETGDAQGCHLHFEMWSAPGWWVGGKPFDPLPNLKIWDSYS